MAGVSLLCCPLSNVLCTCHACPLTLALSWSAHCISWIDRCAEPGLHAFAHMCHAAWLQQTSTASQTCASLAATLRWLLRRWVHACSWADGARLCVGACFIIRVRRQVYRHCTHGMCQCICILSEKRVFVGESCILSVEHAFVGGRCILSVRHAFCLWGVYLVREACIEHISAWQQGWPLLKHWSSSASLQRECLHVIWVQQRKSIQSRAHLSQAWMIGTLWTESLNFFENACSVLRLKVAPH